MLINTRNSIMIKRFLKKFSLSIQNKLFLILKSIDGIQECKFKMEKKFQGKQNVKTKIKAYVYMHFSPLQLIYFAVLYYLSLLLEQLFLHA